MKTLIVYGSKYGFNEDCAVKLKKNLKGEVTCINLKKDEAVEVQKFDRVLIGGSIYAGGIQKEVKKFCEKNLDILLKKEVGIFISGLNVAKYKHHIIANLGEKLVKHAKSTVCVGGEFRSYRMNCIEKFIVYRIRKSKEAYTVQEGFREEDFNKFLWVWNK